jgi:hypothetical protein
VQNKFIISVDLLIFYSIINFLLLAKLPSKLFWRTLKLVEPYKFFVKIDDLENGKHQLFSYYTSLFEAERDVLVLF